MSEYWKSNPRKFCDFCKCWIADNKPSIEYHEKGKKHKENVQVKLEQLRKKGKEDYENKMKEDDYMKSMEDAALRAYKKDIESNPDFTANQIKEIADAKNAKIITSNEANADNKKLLKWKEAKSPEGESYYWHTETGETVWEKPAEGFISLNEQNKKQDKPKKEKSKKIKSDKFKISSPPVQYGPTPKYEPYQSWESTSIPQTEPVPLQLPEVESNEYFVPEVTYKRPPVTFTEKTVTLSKDTINSGPALFKKRKSGAEHKKNIKSRIE